MLTRVFWDAVWRADVSTVTKVWPAIARGETSVTLVSFVLRGASSRRKRRQKRSEARAAAFRARRREKLTVEEAGAASAKYARELLPFAGMSAEAAPFVPLAESAEVLEAAEALAEGIIVRGQDARGIAPPTLSTSLPKDVLAGLNAAGTLQRWWRAQRTERDAARDEDAPVAQADAGVPPAAAAVADLTRDAAPLVADQGAAPLHADTTPEMIQDPPEIRRDAEERLRGRLVREWGILHGLKKQPQHNRKLQSVGEQRTDGRFETVRPGIRDGGAREELTARPENLRLLFEEYQGLFAGDEVDFAGGDLELLGFDPEKAYWEGKQEISSGQYQYVWVPDRLLRGWAALFPATFS